MSINLSNRRYKRRSSLNKPDRIIVGNHLKNYSQESVLLSELLDFTNANLPSSLFKFTDLIKFTNVIFVDAGVTDGGDGTVTAPFNDLKKAIDSAEKYQTINVYSKDNTFSIKGGFQKSVNIQVFGKAKIVQEEPETSEENISLFELDNDANGYFSLIGEDLEIEEKSTGTNAGITSIFSCLGDYTKFKVKVKSVKTNHRYVFHLLNTVSLSTDLNKNVLDIEIGNINGGDSSYLIFADGSGRGNIKIGEFIYKGARGNFAFLFRTRNAINNATSQNINFSIDDYNLTTTVNTWIIGIKYDGVNSFFNFNPTILNDSSSVENSYNKLFVQVFGLHESSRIDLNLPIHDDLETNENFHRIERLLELNSREHAVSPYQIYGLININVNGSVILHENYTTSQLFFVSGSQFKSSSGKRARIFIKGKLTRYIHSSVTTTTDLNVNELLSIQTGSDSAFDTTNLPIIKFFDFHFEDTYSGTANFSNLSLIDAILSTAGTSNEYSIYFINCSFITNFGNFFANKTSGGTARSVNLIINSFMDIRGDERYVSETLSVDDGDNY